MEIREKKQVSRPAFFMGVNAGISVSQVCHPEALAEGLRYNKKEILRAFHFLRMTEKISTRADIISGSMIYSKKLTSAF